MDDDFIGIFIIMFIFYALFKLKGGRLQLVKNHLSPQEFANIALLLYLLPTFHSLITKPFSCMLLCDRLPWRYDKDHDH